MASAYDSNTLRHMFAQVGERLEAIRQYRILTGASLEESRKVVELL